MKKIIALVIVAISFSGCSWFKSSSDWADRNFFSDSNPNQPNSNYPYYYSASAPIDSNEKAAFSSAYPPAAPGSINQGAAAYGQPSYAAQAPGGYGVQGNAPSVSVQYGSKGTDVSAAKTGDAIKSPQPVLPANNPQQGQQLPTLQGTQSQYTPQTYATPYPPQPVQFQQPPQIPAIAPAYPTPPAQPGQPYAQPNPAPYGAQQYPPQAYPQGYPPQYGQPYPPQPYGGQPYPGQYQYPPAK